MAASAERQRRRRAASGQRRPPAAVVVALAAALALSACGGSALEVRSTRAPKSPADSTIVFDCGGYAQVAPVELVLSCRADGEALVRLKWRAWGEERATAVGRLVARPGSIRPVRVEAFGRVLRHDARLAYRRLTVVPATNGLRPLRYELFDGYLQELGGS